MTAVIDSINGVFRKIPVAAVYIALAVPAVWLFYLGFTGGLGIEPIKALEHELGEIALQLLIVGLAITPLRQHLRLNLIKFRRAIGVMAFLYVTLHLLVWLVLDVQIIAQIWADIIKRPYVTIGMAGFLAMVPLAITSNNWSVRKLGPKWRKLHKLTYVAVILGGLHYIWLVKGFQLEPVLYMAVILGLLALRLKPKRRAVAA